MNDFQYIQRLIRLLNEKKIIVDSPLLLSVKPRTKIEQFYQGVSKGELRDDNQASYHLYNKPPTDIAYIMLKKRLEKKLIKQLFLIDHSYENIPKETKAYLELLTQFIAIKIFLNTANAPLAMPLLKKSINVAEKYNFSDLGYLLSSTFVNIINDGSILHEDNPYLLELNKKLKNFQEATVVELKIDTAFSEITSFLNKGSTKRNNKIKENYNELISLNQKLSSASNFKVFKYYYAIAAANIFFKNFKKTIETCETGINKLNKSKLTAISLMYLLKAQCHIHLLDADNAKNALVEGEKNKSNPNSNNFAFLDAKFLIAARSGSFSDLPTIFLSAITNPKFQIQPPIAIESWHQYGLLLLFLIQLDKIPPSESRDRIKPKLRLGKLMNELQEYSKDKAGLNLSIRILHALILLVSKRYEEFEESLPPLQSYIHRYIRKYPELMRSNLLVKMLSQIPKVDYNAERAAWRARPMLEKMIVPPEQLPLKITEMEVIPYEKMWQFVVEFLGTLKKRPHTKPRQP